MGVMQVMRSLLMAQPHRESIVGTNGVATFNDDFKGLMKLTVPFSPVQEGTGDPSPDDNVRPISGWTGCEINLSGANVLFSPPIRQINNCGPNSNGKITYNSYYHTRVHPIPKGLLYLYKQASGSDLTVGFSNNPSLSVGDTTEDALYTKWGSTFQYTNNSYKYAYVTIPRSDSNPHFSIATTGYVRSRAYGKGTRIPITFTDPSTGDPITVYGGTFTLYENGSVVLVADRVLITVTGTETNYSFVSAANSQEYVSGIRTGIQFKQVPSNYGAFSDKLTYWGSNGFAAFPLYGGTAGYNWADAISVQLFEAGDRRSRTSDEIKAAIVAIGGFQAICYLKTPRVYTFDNIGQLKSFIGQNNVWTDLNGDPTVGYWKHG